MQLWFWPFIQGFHSFYAAPTLQHIISVLVIYIRWIDVYFFQVFVGFIVQNSGGEVLQPTEVEVHVLCPTPEKPRPSLHGKKWDQERNRFPWCVNWIIAQQFIHVKDKIGHSPHQYDPCVTGWSISVFFPYKGDEIDLVPGGGSVLVIDTSMREWNAHLHSSCYLSGFFRNRLYVDFLAMDF